MTDINGWSYRCDDDLTSHLVVNGFIHATITTAIDEDRVSLMHYSKRSNALDSDSEAECRC